MQINTIGGKEFASMLSGGTFKLAAYRQDINDLNVFPIPDGDTGDNMLMTFGSGADAAKRAGGDLGAVAKAAAEGMLLGARGNSGVIRGDNLRIQRTRERGYRRFQKGNENRRG